MSQPVGNLQANSYVNRRSEEEIEAVLNEAADRAHERSDISAFRQSYAAGVGNALAWAFGLSNDHPMEGH
jgi:hypothetical protein